jgi:hypothetical protein
MDFQTGFKDKEISQGGMTLMKKCGNKPGVIIFLNLHDVDGCSS